MIIFMVLITMNRLFCFNEGIFFLFLPESFRIFESAVKIARMSLAYFKSWTVIVSLRIFKQLGFFFRLYS